MSNARERLLAGILSCFGAGACGTSSPGQLPRSLLPSGADYAVLEGETRPVLPGGPVSEFRTYVKLPFRPYLTFAVGLAPYPNAPREASTARARFAVDVGAREVYRRDVPAARAGEWIEQSVDLRPYGGRDLTLTFKTSLVDDQGRPIEAGASERWRGVVADPILHDRLRYGRARAVVLISIDTLRRDHVSAYGYRRKTTPTLDALAEDAVLFEDAVSTSSWTLPAHASLFTSLYPTAHGAVDLHTGLPEGLPTLPALLRERGFMTAAMVTHLYLSASYGFAREFERHRYFEETRAKELTDRAIGFLRAWGDRDFFLFLHYYDPHWHYDPPAPFDRTFDPGYRGRATGVWWRFKNETAETLSKEDLAHVVALYDGEIRYTDGELDRFFREMKRLGLFEDALIVVTSDHGEEFLDHGSWEHQKTLYEEQLRIPLLVKLPGGEGRGRRIGEQVRLIDVAPTVSDVLGLPPPSSFQGTSLLPLLRGRASAFPADAWAETEHTVDGSHKVTLRRGAAGEKVIGSFFKGPPSPRLPPKGFGGQGRLPVLEMYTLGSDPREKTPLPNQGSSGAALGLRRLEAFLLEERRLRREGPTAPRIDLPPEALEKLKALGYVR